MYKFNNKNKLYNTFSCINILFTKLKAGITCYCNPAFQYISVIKVPYYLLGFLIIFLINLKYKLFF